MLLEIQTYNRDVGLVGAVSGDEVVGPDRTLGSVPAVASIGATEAGLAAPASSLSSPSSARVRCGPRGGSRVDPAYTEPAPPRVHALPVQRATATVPDRQLRPDPEPDLNTLRDEGAVGLVHRVAVDAPGRGRSAPVERDLARAKPGEVVVEVLVRRLDHVDERLACPAAAQAQLLVQREHAGGGADDGEHAHAHLVEHLEGGHAPTTAPRFPADVVDRQVDGERRGPIRRQLELTRREDEVLGAVGGLEGVVRQREARDRHAHLALADGQLRVGVQRDVLAACRERQARRAPARSVEVRPPELVVGDEAVAGGGCGLRLRRHGFRPQSDRARYVAMIGLLSFTVSRGRHPATPRRDVTFSAHDGSTDRWTSATGWQNDSKPTGPGCEPSPTGCWAPPARLHGPPHPGGSWGHVEVQVKPNARPFGSGPPSVFHGLPLLLLRDRPAPPDRVAATRHSLPARVLPSPDPGHA